MARKAPEEGAPPLTNLAPEAAGDGDESSQAQSVADTAFGHTTSTLSLGDSEKVKSTDPAGDDSADVQDLVDRMRQMDSSGHIDMSAFAGERNDDEEEGRYGEAAEEE